MDQSSTASSAHSAPRVASEEVHHCVHSQDAGGWVRSLAVATFDVGTGHTLEQVYPPDSLDEGDRQRIRMLAMPDCNTTQIGDCFYCFRTRKSHRLPLLSSSLLEQTFEYCYAFFRQEKNEECARGVFQKSVVLVSRYPYVNLFERLVKVIGPLYFAHGPAVLEAVFASLEEWPAPCPGALCPLPFLSETVMFQVPDIDMPPQVASKYRYHRGTHLCSLWPRSRVRSLTRTMSGCGSLDFPQSSPSDRHPSMAESQLNEADEHADRDDGRASAVRRGSTGSGRWSVNTADGMDSLEDLEATTARLTAALTQSDSKREPVVTKSAGTAEARSVKEGTTTSTSATPVRSRVGTAYFTPPDLRTETSGPTQRLKQINPNDNLSTSAILGPVAVDTSGRATSPRRKPSRDWGWAGGDDQLESPGLAGGVSHGGVGGKRSRFWSGAARSPGVLLSPGLQDGAGGLDGAAASRRQSSLGSGSLVSVVSNSPSENWLITPKSVSSPLMVLDRTSGSNLAQSCYYVADRDSEESEESEQGTEGWQDNEEDVEGWQGQAEGAGDRGNQEAFMHSDGVERLTQRSVGDVDGRLLMTIAAVTTDASGDIRDTTERVQDVEALDAALSAVTMAVSLEDDNLQVPASRENDVAPGAGTAATLAMRTPTSEGLAPGSSSLKDDTSSRSVPTDERLDERSTAAKKGKSEQRGRATSLSPKRMSLPMSLPSKPTTSSTPTKEPLSRSNRAATTGTDTTNNGRPWSGLRAWADAAPEDPWDAPPPTKSPFVTRSKSANNSPGSAVTRLWPTVSTGEKSRELRNAIGGEARGSQADSVESEGGAVEGVESAKHATEEGSCTGRKRDETAAHEDSVEAQDRAKIDAARGVAAAIDTPRSGVEVQSRADTGAARNSAGSDGDGGVKDLLEEVERAGSGAMVEVRVDGGVNSFRNDAVDGGDGSRDDIDVVNERAAQMSAVSWPDDKSKPAEDGDGGLSASDVPPDGQELADEAAVTTARGSVREETAREDGEKEKDEKESAKGTEDAAGRRAMVKGRSSSRMIGAHALAHDGRPGSWKSTKERSSIHIHRTASTLQGGRSPFAEMLLADEARFRAKQGLFQSIGLYSIFGKKLVEHLWLLWELVLTGGPTLVVGSSVGASSAAILGMVSLASPVYFGGDFRPHFTTFDPDYREIVAAHDKVSKQQLWGSSVLGVQASGGGVSATGGFPSMLLGVINPIFLRTLSRWPNAIVLPGAAGRSVSSNSKGKNVSHPKVYAAVKLQKELSEDSSTCSPRNRHCPTPKKEGTPAVRPPPVRVQVIRAGASLDQVVGQDERPDEPIIIARQQPVMIPDVAVLSRLLDPSCPYHPTVAAQAAAAAASISNQAPPSTPTSAGVAAMAAQAAAAAKGGKETKGQWKDSLRAINDVILRRHFADLTRSFLSPFDKYFRRSRPPQQLTPWRQKALARLSVYTEPESLLTRFSEETFLTEMSVAGPPKGFAHVQWETLYRRFMESPNFRPWFTTQRIEGVERLREFNRTICLRTPPPILVESCAPARLPQLLAKIKASIEREWKNRGSSVDWDLLERMERHQAAVEAAISAAKGTSGAAATGSMQP